MRGCEGLRGKKGKKGEKKESEKVGAAKIDQTAAYLLSPEEKFGKKGEKEGREEEGEKERPRRRPVHLKGTYSRSSMVFRGRHGRVGG